LPPYLPAVRAGGGKYSTQDRATGESVCTSCIAGKYVVASASDAEVDCTLCGAGKYSTGVGQSAEATCTPCGIFDKYLGGVQRIRNFPTNRPLYC